nr:uncharacterized protein LOC109179346 [Ipomoea batatas]
MLENFKYFTPTSTGVLFELVTDSDCWAICDIGQFPKQIEVWVVGESEGQGDDQPLAEGEFQSEDDADYDEFEYNDDQSEGNDDLDFEGHVDPNIEFAGIGESVDVDSGERVTGAGSVNEGNMNLNETRILPGNGTGNGAKGVDPAANQTAGNQTAIDTAAIHRKPDPRCRNLKQSVGTQLTVRPGKLIPRKRKINETPTTEQGNGSEPIVPLGIRIEDTIAVDFWTTEAVEVAAMFDNVDDAGVDVQQQEEISITPLSQKSDHK